MASSNKNKFRPKSPIIVWDGECDFCRLCADRFKSLAKDNIEFITYQEIFNKYTKAPELDYKKSVVFFTKKDTYKGAAAVFGFYNEIGKKLPIWLYLKLKKTAD